MKIITAGDPKYKSEKIYSVTWEITKFCNFECSYCDVYGVGHNLEHIDTTINFLNKYGLNKNLKITLFGGEPTLHPNLKKIVKELDNDVSLFTNLSAPIKLYEDLFQSDPQLEILTTFHPSKMKFKKYLERVTYLNNLGLNIKATFMLDPKVNLDYRGYYESLSKLNIRVEVHKVVYNNDRIDNSLEEDTLILADECKTVEVSYEDGTTTLVSPEYLLSNHQNNFKFFKCQGGCKNIYISKEGYVYSCLDYRKKDMTLGHITNISEKDLKETICMLSQCTSDLEIPKERILSI